MFDIRKFGAGLSALRKKAKLSQSELAVKLGTSLQSVKLYESGGALPDVSVIAILAVALGVSTGEIIQLGDPTEGESSLLIQGRDSTAKASVEEIQNIAPYLSPELLDKLSSRLAEQGINITSVVAFAEYMSGESTLKMLESANVDALNEELLEKLLPFLDEASKASLFEKILDGKISHKFVKVMLPYTEYLISHMEAAVVDGALDHEVLEIINKYNEDNMKA